MPAERENPVELTKRLVTWREARLPVRFGHAGRASRVQQPSEEPARQSENRDGGDEPRAPFPTEHVRRRLRHEARVGRLGHRPERHDQRAPDRDQESLEANRGGGAVLTQARHRDRTTRLTARGGTDPELQRGKLHPAVLEAHHGIRGLHVHRVRGRGGRGPSPRTGAERVLRREERIRKERDDPGREPYRQPKLEHLAELGLTRLVRERDQAGRLHFLGPRRACAGLGVGRKGEQREAHRDSQGPRAHRGVPRRMRKKLDNTASGSEAVLMSTSSAPT